MFIVQAAERKKGSKKQPNNFVVLFINSEISYKCPTIRKSVYLNAIQNMLQSLKGL